MNLFDIRTILFSHVITNAICLMVVVSLWFRNHKRFGGLGFWLASFILQFVAILLIALRGFLPVFLSIVVGNSLLMAATILLFIGMEHFTDKRTSQVHNYLLLAMFIFIHFYFTVIQISLLVRTINLAVGIILLCSQCAWLLMRRVEADLRPITRQVGTIFLTFCAFSILRIILVLLVHPGNDFFQSGFLEALAILINQMLIVVLTFGLLSMVNRRLVRELEQEIIERKQAEPSVLELGAIKERERLARDLHDSVNQSVHSVVLFSETLVSVLEKNNLDRARQIADRLQESARQALKETRLLLYEIQTPALERNVNLIPDLEARLASVERRAGVRAKIIQEGSLEPCPPAWYTNLFWIAIEALNNALKHAQARTTKVVIRCSQECLEMDVWDDGIGFHPQKTRVGGMGLGNMRERAALLGGGLEIISTPGKGTCIRFYAEIKEQHGQNAITDHR